MIRKGNVTIGLQTRFGPGWTGIRCGARTKLGGECQRPAVKKTGRCTRHGGKSTGPRTQAGRNKIAALHTTHGKYTKAKRREAQKSAEVGRKVLRRALGPGTAPRPGRRNPLRATPGGHLGGTAHGASRSAGGQPIHYHRQCS